MGVTMSTIQQSKLRNDQRGVGSLLFTMVMMIVISLVVLGFAQLARRGQRETLDNQLSSQAYYAAESGVNDAIYALGHGATWQQTDASDCTSFYTRNAALITPSLKTSNGLTVQYTCLKVDKSPSSELIYKNNDITQSSDEVIPITPTDADGNVLTDPSSFTGVTVSWNSSASGDVSNCDTTNYLPPSTAAAYTCPYAMLRIDVLPVPTGSFSKTQVQTKTMSVLVKPESGADDDAATVTYSPTANRIVPATCTSTTCSVTINLSNKSYIMRIGSLYGKPGEVDITPNGDGTARLAGAQEVIDATGQAQDVLRRVQVRVPLGDTTVPSSGAIESNQSVCKRFTVGDGVAYAPAPTTACPTD